MAKQSIRQYTHTHRTQLASETNTFACEILHFVNHHEALKNHISRCNIYQESLLVKCTIHLHDIRIEHELSLHN